MFSEEIKEFIDRSPMAFVASADQAGTPHLAAARNLRVLDDDHLVFENWFCPTTLANVTRNRRLAVAIATPDATVGFQFLGTVSEALDTAILDGYLPGGEAPGFPQSLTRLVIRVETVLPFVAGVHADGAGDRRE